MRVYIAGNNGGLTYRERFLIEIRARRLFSFVYHHKNGKYRAEFTEWVNDENLFSNMDARRFSRSNSNKGKR